MCFSSSHFCVFLDSCSCYHTVSRLEAELLLEREAKRGNMLLRPGRSGDSFAVSTRQDHDGYKHTHSLPHSHAETHFLHGHYQYGGISVSWTMYVYIFGLFICVVCIFFSSISAVFKHYRVTRRHDGGFNIDVDNPVSIKMTYLKNQVSLKLLWYAAHEWLSSGHCSLCAKTISKKNLLFSLDQALHNKVDWHWLFIWNDT